MTFSQEQFLRGSAVTLLTNTNSPCQLVNVIVASQQIS